MTHYQNEKDDLLDYFARMLSNPEDYDAKESLSATKKVEKNSQLSLNKEQAKVTALQQENCEQEIKDEVSSAEDKAAENSVEITDNKNTASNFDTLGNSSQETVVTHDEQVSKNADTQIITSVQDSIDAQCVESKSFESKSDENQAIEDTNTQSLDEHDLVEEHTVFKENSANTLKDHDICESVAQDPLATQGVIEPDHVANKDHEDIQDNSSQDENKEPLAMIVPIISLGSQENEATQDHDTEEEKLSSKLDANEDEDTVQKAQISSNTCNIRENEDLVKSERDVELKIYASTASNEECSKSVQNLSVDAKSSVNKEESKITPKEHVHIPEVAMQKQQISEEKTSTFVRTTPSLEALLEKVNSDLEKEQLEKEQLEKEQLEKEQNVALKSEVKEQCNVDVKTALADKVTTTSQDLVQTQTKLQDEQKIALTEVPVQQTTLQMQIQEQKTEPKVEAKVAELTVQDTICETAQKTIEETASKTAEQQTAVLTEPQTQSANKIETKCETQVESATVVATDTENKVKEQVKTKTLESSEIQTASKIEIAQITQKELQSQTKEAVKERVDTTIATATSSESSQQIPELAWSKLELPDEFQVLFFLVKGVRFAVPLIALGGIFECTRLTQIAGRPAWYKGMSDIRGTKLSVVDTMAWVKPEDRNEHDYKYLIVLDRSNWALGCDELEGNRVLQKSQLKLREKAGSRPWLAGIVKKEMCALLHVQAMTAMFDRGMALNKQV